MSVNDRIYAFMFDESGIENIFKNLGQVTVSAAIFKISLIFLLSNIALAVVSIVFSLLLFSLSLIYGGQKIILPIMKAFYGEA